MTEPTDRDRKLFFDALEDLQEVMSIGGPAAMLTMGKHFVPAIAAARQEGRCEERLRGNRSDDAITGEALAGLPEDQLSSKAAIAWLTEAARYFSARNTGGEDAAHWANISNSIMCRRIADLIKALST